MAEVKKIQADLSRTQAIAQLSENDQILEGRIDNQDYDKYELDYVYDSLAMARKYNRDVALGNTRDTYTGWVEYKQESGYSIWKYPVTDFAHASNNQMFLDEQIMTYKGQADSESITAFNKVFSFYWDTYTDVTEEAGTEGGTAFSFLQYMDGVSSFLFLGSSEPFRAVALNLETIGSNYGLRFDYWDGSDWVAWDGTCELSGWVDNTLNLTNNGRIEFNLPEGWVQNTIDGETYYWGRLHTSTAPAVVAAAYSVLPGNSIPTLLSLSQTQYLNEDWAWAYFNNYVYVTLRNTGDSYYEGDYYIKGSSIGTKKQNYFIYNHAIKTNYLRSDYTPYAPGGINYWDRDAINGIMYPHTIADKVCFNGISALGTVTIFDSNPYSAGSIDTSPEQVRYKGVTLTCGLPALCITSVMTGITMEGDAHPTCFAGLYMLHTSYGDAQMSIFAGGHQRVRITSYGDFYIQFMGTEEFKIGNGSKWAIKINGQCMLGFFDTEVVTKQSVSSLGAWSDISSGTDSIDLADLNSKTKAIRDKLEEVTCALQVYGLL